MRGYHVTQPVDLNLALKRAGEAAREPKRQAPYIPPFDDEDDLEDAADAVIRKIEKAKRVILGALTWFGVGFALAAGMALFNLGLATLLGMPIIP